MIPHLMFLLFQSTRPGRSATSLVKTSREVLASFNPRAPGGARHGALAGLFAVNVFQSTRPGRSATVGVFAVRSK